MNDKHLRNIFGSFLALCNTELQLAVANYYIFFKYIMMLLDIFPRQDLFFSNRPCNIRFQPDINDSLKQKEKKQVKGVSCLCWRFASHHIGAWEALASAGRVGTLTSTLLSNLHHGGRGETIWG